MEHRHTQQLSWEAKCQLIMTDKRLCLPVQVNWKLNQCLEAFFTADILTCHSWKNTGITNNIAYCIGVTVCQYAQHLLFRLGWVNNMYKIFRKVYHIIWRGSCVCLHIFCLHASLSLNGCIHLCVWYWLFLGSLTSSWISRGILSPKHRVKLWHFILMRD